jgi:hypothetical protein
VGGRGKQRGGGNSGQLRTRWQTGGSTECCTPKAQPQKPAPHEAGRCHAAQRPMDQQPSAPDCREDLGLPLQRGLRSGSPVLPQRTEGPALGTKDEAQQTTGRTMGCTENTRVRQWTWEASESHRSRPPGGAEAPAAQHDAMSQAFCPRLQSQSGNTGQAQARTSRDVQSVLPRR